MPAAEPAPPTPPRSPRPAVEAPRLRAVAPPGPGPARRALSAFVERASRMAVGYQRWHEILFLHFDLPPPSLRPLVDPRLDLDLFEGRAWVSLTPFTMRGARLRLLPPLPTLSRFHELSLRTCVRHAGVPGLWFLSLDAASTAATALARLSLGLPCFRARIERSSSGHGHEYRAERLPPRPEKAHFAASWSAGERLADVPRPLDQFLAERYALYTSLGGALVRVRVRHPPWPLREARVERLDETISGAAGIQVPDRPTLARFSDGVDVEVLVPEIVR